MRTIISILYILGNILLLPMLLCLPGLLLYQWAEGLEDKLDKRSKNLKNE